MLAALEESTRAQRQLVADASHELRTPLTSVRTNIEVLAGDRALPPEERRGCSRDVVEQLGEMTTLISELIELARAEQQTVEPEDVRLDLLVADARRARAPEPARGRVLVELEPSRRVHGVSGHDRARRRQPPRQRGEVEPAGSRGRGRGARRAARPCAITGPGIADEDLPYVFDRFYRARSARGMPGSGLGLAIVRQVAEAHGGEVVAERADGGGTRMRARLWAAQHASRPTS